MKDLQESVNVSLMRYRGGTSNYLDVLDSQRSLFSAELTLAQARNNEYQSLVQLYKALGGGLEISRTAKGRANVYSSIWRRDRSLITSRYGYSLPETRGLSPGCDVR